jgi:hypothetical protein
MQNSRRPISRDTAKARNRVAPAIDFAQIYREVGETTSISRILEKKQERFRTKSEYRSKLPATSNGVLYTHQSANLSDFHERLTLA